MDGLVTVYSLACGRALVAHGACYGLTTEESLLPSWERLKPIVVRTYTEMLDTVKLAMDAHMGEAMYKHLINTYANSAAVEALKPDIERITAQVKDYDVTLKRDVQAV